MSSLKKTFKAQMKKAKLAEEKSLAKKKDFVPAYKVMPPKTEAQQVKSVTDEKDMREFLTELRDEDDEIVQQVDIAMFTDGNIPASRKEFFRKFENIPVSQRFVLLDGLLKQSKLKSLKYLDDWISDAEKYKAYLTSSSSKIDSQDLKLGPNSGAPEFAKYVLTMELGDEELNTKLLELKKLEAKIKLSKKIDALRKGEVTEDQFDDMEKARIEEEEVFGNDIEVDEFRAEAIRKALLSKIKVPSAKPLHPKIQQMVDDAKIRNISNVPDIWIQEELQKESHGHSKKTNIDQIVDGKPLQRGDLATSRGLESSRCQVYDDIWNLEAQILSAWRQLETVDMPTDEIIRLEEELRVLNDTTVDYDSSNRVATELQLKVRDHSDEYNAIYKSIRSMEDDLKELKKKAPRTIRQYEKINACSKVYKEAPWLRTKVKAVYISPMDVNQDIFVKFARLEESKDVDGRTWYLAKSWLFEALCTTRGKTQDGDTVTVPIEPVLARELNILGGHPKLRISMAYETHKSFIVQDEDMYKDERKYFISTKRNLTKQSEALGEELVSGATKKLGAIVLSDALQSTVVNEETDNSKSGLVQIEKYASGSNFVTRAIGIISQERDGISTTNDFATKLGEIVIYIDRDGSKVFEKRLANGYYDAEVLMSLPQSEKNPELFDDPSTNSDISKMYRMEYASKLEKFRIEFLHSAYLAQTGERRIASHVKDLDSVDQLRVCHNSTFLTDARNKALKIEETKPLQDRKDIPDLSVAETNRLEKVNPRDIIRYMEDGEVYCLTVPELRKMELSGLYVNPITKKPLARDFVKRFKDVHINDKYDINKYSVSQPVKEDTAKVLRKLEPILAPGLIALIKDGIASLKSSESDSDDDGTPVSRTRGGGDVKDAETPLSRSRGESSSDDESPGNESDVNYDGICRHCKGEIPTGSKGIRTLSEKKNSSKDATGSDGFHKREFCCRYCCEDCEKEFHHKKKRKRV